MAAAHPAKADNSDAHKRAFQFSGEGRGDEPADRLKSGIHVSLDVNAQPWPAALGEHVEVAERLRQLDGPKARPVAGNGKVGLGCSW